MSIPPSDPIDVDAIPSSPQITTQHDIHELPDEGETMREPSHQSDGRPRYKSWRKKYRKMRLKFDKVMDETNHLFIQEHSAWNIARRLQEEIDQILELLIELNEDPKTPAHLRWDLRLPDDPDLLQLSHPASAPETVPPPRSLARLYTRTLHTCTHPSAPLPSDLLPSDLLDLDPSNTFTSTTPPSYLTPEHESLYLTALDAGLSSSLHPHTTADSAQLPPGIETVAPPPAPLRTRTLPTERDFALKCPVSVHAWLKRNQPQVFESTALDGKGARRPLHLAGGGGGGEGGDSEADAPGSSHGGGAGGGGGATGRGRKSLLGGGKEGRTRMDAGYEALDEEIGSDPSEGGGGGTGRRRGKVAVEEESYRPKGGRGGNGGKRKRAQADLGHDAVEVKKMRKSGVGGGGGGGGGGGVGAGESGVESSVS